MQVREAGSRAQLSQPRLPLTPGTATLQKYKTKRNLLERAMFLRCGSSIGGTWKLMLQHDTRGHCKPGSFGFGVGQSKN